MNRNTNIFVDFLRGNFLKSKKVNKRVLDLRVATQLVENLKKIDPLKVLRNYLRRKSNFIAKFNSNQGTMQ